MVGMAARSIAAAASSGSASTSGTIGAWKRAARSRAKASSSGCQPAAATPCSVGGDPKRRPTAVQRGGHEVVDHERKCDPRRGRATTAVYSQGVWRRTRRKPRSNSRSRG